MTKKEVLKNLGVLIEHRKHVCKLERTYVNEYGEFRAVLIVVKDGSPRYVLPKDLDKKNIINF